MLNGKTHYKWAIFSSYVKLPEGINGYKFIDSSPYFKELGAPAVDGANDPPGMIKKNGHSSWIEIQPFTWGFGHLEPYPAW